MKCLFSSSPMVRLSAAVLFFSIVNTIKCTAVMVVGDTSFEAFSVFDNSTEAIQRDLMDSGSVQLKVHWERGYSWRNNNWCAACRGDCSGGKVVLVGCNNNDKGQKWSLKNGKISPSKNSKGCMTHDKRSRVSIQRCKSSRDETQEVKVKKGSGRFQIIGNEGCLTVRNDILRFSSCNVAAQNEVLYWESGSYSSGSNKQDDDDGGDDDGGDDGGGGGGSSRSFQMKLYWQQGYNWQNNPKEKAWCMECKDECRDGKRIYVRECNPSNKRQKWVFKNNKFSPAGSQGLCAHFNDIKSELSLGGCGRISSQHQKFTEKKSGNKFRYNVKGRCLTQHHHPRDHEKLRLGPCAKATRDNTVFWVKGSFGGHKG